jgi:hypothetical protein
MRLKAAWTSGNPVARPDHPDLAWLCQHARCRHSSVLGSLLDAERHGGNERAFLCGSAANSTGSCTAST